MQLKGRSKLNMCAGLECPSMRQDAPVYLKHPSSILCLVVLEEQREKLEDLMHSSAQDAIAELVRMSVQGQAPSTQQGKTPLLQQPLYKPPLACCSTSDYAFILSDVLLH